MMIDWSKVKTFEDLKAVVHIDHYPQTLGQAVKHQVRIKSGQTREQAYADVEHLLVDEDKAWLDKELGHE